MNLAQALRRAARASRNNLPVVIVAGDAPPRERGSGWHYTTPGGDPVRYPNAYRKAWGKPVYHPSTSRIEVGAEWPMHVGLATRVLREGGAL